MSSSDFHKRNLKLSDVLDLLDVRYPPSAVCSITVIPTLEKEAIESDCDSNGSDREYQGKTGHLPGRLLNGDAEVNYLEDEADVHGNQLVCPTPPPPTPAAVGVEANSLPLPYLGKSPTATSRKRRCPEENETPPRNKKQKTSLQNMQNRDRVFKRSKPPATSKIPDFVTYGPTAAECIKQTKPDPVDLFLLMYPPTLRELTLEMSNTYSMQTKGKILDLNMD
ncbi:hypothetical protein SKAU_G00414520 [Synaphobranchus kaupii]|uniref:Uncharacterized protein n=1 Tax=Synaphobranchus kaupii TaxID=118154 RepID=A0A9Q1E753_SYNKA|nr:hypothetical protein SKAU_G00414520 [Synaphobranchus kaupii]